MSHRMPPFAVIAVISVVAAVAVFASAPLQAETRPPASVAELAWIAGDWQGQKDGDSLDETWSAPAAGTMMGMFRWIKDGKVQMYELLSIQDSAKGPVLFLRHFNPDFTGWEEKDAPVRCPISGGGPGEAVFACEGRPTRLIFRRTGDSSITVLLERQQDGKARTDEFLYTRRK
jgi:hypothetical protein